MLVGNGKGKDVGKLVGADDDEGVAVGAYDGNGEGKDVGDPVGMPVGAALAVGAGVVGSGVGAGLIVGADVVGYGLGQFSSQSVEQMYTNSSAQPVSYSLELP